MAPDTSEKECALLYSGGTDSTCTAMLLGERFERVHLLTFEEDATRSSAFPDANVQRLRDHFDPNRFPHQLLYIEPLLKTLSTENYLQNLRRHGLFMLSNCGFSSLSWHVRTIVYCLDNNITVAADGVTQELTHFPGHMDVVLRLFKSLYAHFGIAYENPVRDWGVPPDPRFLNRLIVNTHPAPAQEDPPLKTTGHYLYEHGILPHPNLKGSDLDRSMQHDCYPFVLFNIFVFWIYLAFHSYDEYEERMHSLFSEKTRFARSLLEDYELHGLRSALGACITQ